MQKRNVLSSPRLNELKKQRRKVAVNKFLIIFFIAVILFALGAYLSQLKDLNISQVEISGNKIIDTNEIKYVVDEQIAGKYLRLFPKSNVLYYSKSAIKTGLQNKFHRLGNIDLSIKDRKTLLVSVLEREAKYLWCGMMPASGVQHPTEEKCYFLDDTGYVFDEAPYFSGEVYFKFYGHSDAGRGTSDRTGFYFSERNFRQLVSFKDVLINIGLKPVVINILENGDIELFLARGNSSKTGPKIIFKPDADLLNVAENLQAALVTEPLLSGFKNKYSSLLYIDLRFGNKVYFKFMEWASGAGL
ncbi:hypothetical protein HYW73_02005 [Candidatus Nomurabacteria bacterium]|nr:hypothetical protein [Candidatus Nomurabacteria bacterium]